MRLLLKASGLHREGSSRRYVAMLFRVFRIFYAVDNRSRAWTDSAMADK